jgi:TatD DNase family protein
VLERAVEAGIERILVPGWDLASSEAALELAARHGPLVQAAVGVHPHDVAVTDEAAWGQIEVLTADPGCVAVGEIGLDFHRLHSPRAAQEEGFERQLALATRRDLPVVVHDREAHDEIAAALTAWPGRGMLHAYSGDAAMAVALGARGFVVSLAFPVAFRSAVGPRAAAAVVESGAYLVETDGPYLGPDREARNEPTTVLRVAAEVAILRSVAVEDVARDVRRAYDRLFGE